MARSRWHLCNVLQIETERRNFWQFAADGDFKLLKEQSDASSQPIASKWVGKNWRSLLQKKLNIAWLPPEEVFLRVVQLPAGSFNELLSMLELQLEKLSPIPVGQAMWTLEVIPPKRPQPDNLQTVLVAIVPRHSVEMFLGNLESQGYLADRLELKFIDQLLATDVDSDGVWIYPGVGNDKSTFLLAWWYGGILRHVGVVNIPAGEANGETIREQLTHMAWAGEMDGWLAEPPQLHLVGDQEIASLWEPILQQTSDLPIKIVPPLPDKNLALLSARRAAQSGHPAGLLPAEYSSRYHQQYVDRLWMRGLGAAVLVYIFFLIAYFGALQVLKFQNTRAGAELKTVGGSYTNAMQIKERIRLIQDQMSLKTAALDSLRSVAELLPADYVLTRFGYHEGRGRVTVMGTSPKEEQIVGPSEFYEALKKATNSAGEPLFRRDGGDPPNPRISGNNLMWQFTLELAVGGNER